MIVFHFCPWKPGRFRRGTGTKRLLTFGRDVTGFNVVNYFAENSDYMLIGRFMGSGPLGLYMRAYQLFFMPLSQVTFPMSAVAMPALSVLRETPTRYSAYVRRLLGLVALLAVPLSAYCVLEGDFVIRLALGEQWLGAVPAFRFLAIGGLVHAVASTRGLILLSSGMSRKYLQLGVANSLVRVLGVLSGLAFGVTGVAAGTAIAILAFFVPSLYYFLRGTPVAPRDYMRALAVPLAYGALATVAGVLPKVLLARESWVLSNVVASAVFLLVYGGLCASNKPIRESLLHIRSAIGSKTDAPLTVEERIEIEHDSI